MSSKHANNSRSEVQNTSTFSAYIAKAAKITVKIRHINADFARQYKVQPLLLLVPFVAGLVAAGLFMGDRSDKSSLNELAVNTAGFSLSGTTSGASGNLPGDNGSQLLLAQAEAEPADESQAEDDVAPAKIEISQEMRDELSPEEIAIFEAFSEMAELQAQKGIDSPEVKALSEKLDGLIEQVKVKQEQELAKQKAEYSEVTEDDEQPSDEPAEKPVARPADTRALQPKDNAYSRQKTLRPAPADEQVKTAISSVATSQAKAEPNHVIVKPVQPEQPKELTTAKAKEPEVKPVVKNVTTPTVASVKEKTAPVEEKPTAKAESGEPVAEKANNDILDEGKIRIKTNDGMIDLNELLIAIGKELELNYYFEDGVIPSGRIMLQQYGEIDRSELLPLLESVLAKSDYMMVKQGPYTKIVKRNEIHKNTTIFSPDLGDEIDPKRDSVVATIISLEHVNYEKVKGILEKFVAYTDIITPIDNTNKIVITDYARSLARIKDIIKMIDVPGPEKKLKIIVPSYLKPDDAKTTIEDMYNKLYGESGINVGQRSDSANQQVTTPAPEMNVAEMNPAQRAEYIRSRRDAANQRQAATPAGNSEIPMPDITVDKRTGRIFVIGTEAELENVTTILNLFDVPKSGPQVKLEKYSPVYVDSKNVVTQIESLMKAMNDEENGLKSDQGDSGAVAEQEQGMPQIVRGEQMRDPRRATTTSQESGTSSIPGMFVLVDERTNRIIVLGWPDQIKLFEELLALFDVPLPGGEILLEIIGLENTEATDTVSKVKDLINAINKQSSGKAPGTGTETTSVTSRRPTSRNINPNNPNANTGQSANGSGTTDEESSGPFMMADERLNRIFVIGVREQIDQAKELTEMIDQQWPGSKVRLEIFTFNVVEVEAITEQITELIQALNANEETRSGANSSTDRRRSQAAFPNLSNQPGNNNNNGSGNDSQSSFQQAGEEGPFLMADNRLNRLFVVGLDEQITQVEELIQILDKSIGLDLKIIPAFKYILSSDAADQMAKLLSIMREQEEAGSGSSGSSSSRTNNRSNTRNNQNNLNDQFGQNTSSRNNTNRTTQSREGISSIISVSQRGPFLLPDDRTNRLLVVSTPEQYNELISLIPVLDVPPSKYDEMIIESYQPEFVTVEEVKTILDDLGLTQSSADLDEKYQRRNGGSSNTNNRINTNIADTRDMFQYRNTDSATMIGNIEEPEIFVAVHKTSNRIFIYAAKYQHEEIARMIAKIDVQPDSNLGDYEVFSIKHRKPEDLATVLNELLVENDQTVSEEMQEVKGKTVIVPVTDTPFIVVRADQQKRAQISKLIDELDKAMPQVLIEAQFIQISLDDSFKLGVSLQESFSTGGSDSVSGISPMNLGEISTNSNGVAMGSGGTIAFFHDDMIHATLEALATQTNSEVTSSPRLLVNNNSEASFTSTKQKPTTKTTLPAGSDTPITEFNEYVEAGTTLTITPQIGMSDMGAALEPGEKIEEGFISLDITINVDSFEGEGSDGIPPGKSTNELKTNILLPDGATIIMGGLTQTNWSDTVRKVPILGDIPVVGALFRSINKAKGKTVLYMFIKATIAFDPNRDPDFKSLKKLSEIDQKEMKKLRESFNGMPIIPGFKDGKPLEDEKKDTDEPVSTEDKPQEAAIREE